MIAINKRFFRHFDWISCCLMLTLVFLGALFIFSATYRPEQPFSLFFKKQLFGIVAGIILYIIGSLVDYRVWMRIGYFLYLATIGLLVFTVIKGSVGMGAQRWINLFIFRIQPSELIKLLFPAFVAYYLHTHKNTETFSFKHFVPLIATIGVSLLLIAKQPDLGTALLILFSSMILLWLAGINKKFFLYGFLIALVSAPISWQFLKEYQKKRIYTFLGQEKSRKELYQIEQSHIAIGSGGLFGKGLLQGTQNRLLFLPASRTDFIFSVLCEELGFVGALFVLFLYLSLFLRLLFLASTLQKPIMQLFATGLLIHIILSTIINLAMITGLLPIVGIPLPFMSYGLSNLLVNFISLGWFQSITMQRTYIVK